MLAAVAAKCVVLVNTVHDTTPVSNDNLMDSVWPQHDNTGVQSTHKRHETQQESYAHAQTTADTNLSIMQLVLALAASAAYHFITAVPATLLSTQGTLLAIHSQYIYTTCVMLYLRRSIHEYIIEALLLPEVLQVSRR